MPRTTCSTCRASPSGGAGAGNALAPLALSPDGTRPAYAYSGAASRHGRRPVPTGLTIVDLRTGERRAVLLSRGRGILVRTMSWSPQGRWLVWDGQVSTRWNARQRSFGDEMVAGRIAPGSRTSEPVPASNRDSDSFGIDDDGRVAISAADRVEVWDGGVVRHTTTPASSSPLAIAHLDARVTDVRTPQEARAPAWATEDESSWVWAGLAVAGVAALGAGVLV